MTTKILLALMCLVVPPKYQEHNGEDEDAARDRYEVIAAAVSELAADDGKLALLLLTTARHESAFVRDVHSGKRRGDATDKAPKGRSWSLFQFMCGPRSSCKIPRTEYTAADVVGVDASSTRRAVAAAIVHMRIHLKRCRGHVWCVFRNYIGAPRGKLKPEVKAAIRARVATYQRLQRESKP